VAQKKYINLQNFQIGGGNWNSLTNTDATDFIKIKNIVNSNQTGVNFDLKFEEIENQYTCYGVYADFKVYFDIGFVALTTPISYRLTSAIRIIGDGASVDSYSTLANGNEDCHNVLVVCRNISNTNYRVQFSVDSQTSFINEREEQSLTYYKYSPNILKEATITFNDLLNTDE
jgi:hypothetical protein